MEVEFPSGTTKFALIRAACVAANLVATKVVDGIAKLLTKSDIIALSKKPMLLQLSAADSVLTEGWAATRVHIEKKEIDEHKAYACFGRFSLRCALYLCKKQKEGPEGRIFDTITASKAEFVHDMQLALGQEVTMSSPCSAPAAEAIVELTDVANPKWIASQAGYTTGALYVDKVGGDNVIYKLTEMDSAVRFVQVHLGPATPKEKVVSFSELKKVMAPSKGKLPEKLTLSLQNYMPNNHAELKRDKMRAQAFLELMQLAEQHCVQEFETVEHYLHPMQVRCKAQVEKGELVLIPCAPIAKIVSVASDNATLGSQIVSCNSDEGTMYIEHPATVKRNDVAALKDTTVLSAFWWVLPSMVGADVNMAFNKITVGQFSFIVLTNIRKLAVFEKLCVATTPASKRHRA